MQSERQGLLTGEYEDTVDSKGRIRVPKKLRDMIEEDSLYLVLGSNGILSLYPESHFERLLYSMVDQNLPPDEFVIFERMYFGLADKVKLDGHGKITLNKRLKERATLGDQVTFIGVRDHMELWNRQRWEQYVSDNIAQYYKQAERARKALLESKGR